MTGRPWQAHLSQFRFSRDYGDETSERCDGSSDFHAIKSTMALQLLLQYHTRFNSTVIYRTTSFWAFPEWVQIPGLLHTGTYYNSGKQAGSRAAWVITKTPPPPYLYSADPIWVHIIFILPFTQHD